MSAPKDTVRRNIDEHGQHIWRIPPGDAADEPGFMYAVGNHQHGLPELLIVGPWDSQFMDILNCLGEMQRRLHRAFQDGERVDLGGEFPVRIVDAGAEGRESYAVQVGVYYGTENFEVRQVLMCDRFGRWPGNPECESPYRDQPILGRHRKLL